MDALKTQKIGSLVLALLVCCVAGLASAKLPALNDEQKAKAAEAKAKADDAAKRESELLAKSQDRVADRYKRERTTSRRP
jgi:hypothetical protein